MPLIRFTPKQRAKMLRCFGKEFMKALPTKIANYAAQWRLSDFALIEYYSWNCLLSCRSEIHGDCVLKIFSGGSDYYLHEVRTLAEQSENCRYVQVYERDEECGALLLERVCPGTTLKAEPLLEKRLEAFVDVYQNAHITPHEPDAFESYLEAVQRAANSPWASGDIPELRRAGLDAAAVCHDLYDKYPARQLLHTDLHGDNLLMNAHGGYTIVDPHGRIGPPICDLGRYIANEYFDADPNTRADVTSQVIAQLSDALKLPRVDVLRIFFVDITLMSCWGAENGDTSTDGVLFAEGLLRQELQAQS